MNKCDECGGEIKEDKKEQYLFDFNKTNNHPSEIVVRLVCKNCGRSVTIKRP